MTTKIRISLTLYIIGSLYGAAYIGGELLPDGWATSEGLRWWSPPTFILLIFWYLSAVAALFGLGFAHELAKLIEKKRRDDERTK